MDQYFTMDTTIRLSRLATQQYNVYCDKSCHLEKNGVPVMAWGATYCLTKRTRHLVDNIRLLKIKHGLSPDFEIKWNKVSPAKLEFYLDLIKYYFNEDDLRFRGLLVQDKSKFHRSDHIQSNGDWYFKLYDSLLQFIFNPQNQYCIYMDRKNRHEGRRIKKIHNVLATGVNDLQHNCVNRVQMIQSQESELLQIADLLLGALTYANRNLVSSSAKVKIVRLLRMNLGSGILTNTSIDSATKFNLLVLRHADTNEKTT